MKLLCVAVNCQRTRAAWISSHVHEMIPPRTLCIWPQSVPQTRTRFSAKTTPRQVVRTGLSNGGGSLPPCYAVLYVETDEDLFIRPFPDIASSD